MTTIEIISGRAFLVRVRLAVATVTVGICAAVGICANPPAPLPSPPAMLPPVGKSPAPTTRPTLVAVPYRTWMPPARSDGEPRMLPTDKRHALPGRPAIDLPPVAEARGDLPVAVTIIVEPPVRLVSPSPAMPPVATIAVHEDTGKPTIQTDPTQNLAPPGALILSPPPRTAPAPFLLLAIPDPSRFPGEIATPAPKQDHAPSPSFDLPAGPKITVPK